MNRMRSVSAFVFLMLVCIVFVRASEGIEINPTKEQIDQAIDYGKSHSKDIFKSKHVGPAVFGNWPSAGGGLVKSKLVQVAVVSAMKKRARKKMKEEDTKSLLEINSLAISYKGGADVYMIKLRQGVNVIEPFKMVRPDMTGKGPSGHKLFITARFPYSKIDLNAKTTIIVEKDFGSRKYNVDFSSIP